jgi:hypothetical protein
MFGPLAKCYDGISVHETAIPGDVQFVFHTYHGFLAFFVQTEHRISAPPEEALQLLWRLHRFNLTWGMFAAGAAFVPILSYFNYIAQKRSIMKQAAT